MKKLLKAIIVIFAAFLLMGASPALPQNAATAVFDTRIPALPAEADVKPPCPAGSMPDFEEDAKDSKDFTCVPVAQSAIDPTSAEQSAKPSAETAPQKPADPAPPAAAQIAAGGRVFDQENIGCRASKDADGKIYLMPLQDDVWIATNNYSAKTTVNGVAVYSSCIVGDTGLEVVISAQGYLPQIFSAKWD
ncbi:MAG: hypothetical protein P4M13_01410 [Alphaproteobacteria bacterium]|nr:hypothetical protein [Alphaproteobacteria bacterium]